MDIARTRGKLRSLAQLEELGITDADVRKRVAAGSLLRVHSGLYVRTEDWDAAYPEERHLIQVLAVHRRVAGADVVACLVSAGVLWSLPLFGISPTRVHLAGSSVNGLVGLRQKNDPQSRTPLVARHEMSVAPDDIVERFGIRCTSLGRTVFDIVRSVSIEAGLAVADAALRQVAWSDATRTYDTDAAEEWRRRMSERLDAAAGYRGIRRARWVIAFADGRAQLPGETVSRYRFHQVGFEAPVLQVPVAGPDGELWFVDFWLPDARAWGEFDGDSKYFDAQYAKGRSPKEVLDLEKRRQDSIRGRSQHPFARWGMYHIATPERFARRLADFHIFPRR